MQKLILAAGLLLSTPAYSQQVEGPLREPEIFNDDEVTLPETPALPATPTFPATPAITAAPEVSLQSLLAGTSHPLKLQLKDLNGQWRRLTISGQFEMGDLTKMYSSVLGGGGNDAYYTRGQTVRVAGETYLVAYRTQLKNGGLNLVEMMQSGMSGGNPDYKPPTPEKLTANSALALTLLNLRTIGSLKDIRSFNLQQEISTADNAKGPAGDSFEKAQSSARSTASNSNLKQIGLGLLMYVQDYDEVLPPMKDLATAKKALLPYIKSEQVFTSPIAGQTYQPNPILSGKKMAHMTDPASMAVFYEDKAAPDKTRGVVFLDGRVKRVSETDWPTVKKASKLP